MRGTRLDLRLNLPRTGISPRLARTIVDSALACLDVALAWRRDLAQAVSEACNNAVRYAGASASYEVRLTVTDVACHVSITDMGPGFPALRGIAMATMPPPDVETGRGLPLIAMLVDRVRVNSRPGAGTTLQVTKHLAAHPG